MRGFKVFATIAMLGVLGACDDDAPKAGAALPTMFVGDVSGEFSGKVVGGGILQHRPNAGYDEQGYFFLADAAGERDLGVTFVLPHTVAPGHHPVASVGPKDQGKIYSVRIDRDMGTSLHSLEQNAQGYLDITRFPGTGEEGPVTGTYDVTVEDSAGKTVRVTGVFDFVAK